MAKNDFLVFDELGTNELTQAEYASDSQRIGGVAAGIARKELFNKVFKQTSMMAAAIGDIAKDNGGVIEDTSLEDLKTALLAARDVLNLGKTRWDLLTSYTTAGAYTWTAPNLNDGADYEIGILIVGAGGGGGAAKKTSSSSYETSAAGGASGYARSLTMEVSPGAEYPIVVGIGGAPAQTGVLADEAGNGSSAGGSSSFNAIVAEGGSPGAGKVTDASSTIYGAVGGQGSSAAHRYINLGFSGEYIKTPYGGIASPYEETRYNSIPSMCINPFTKELLLFAGGVSKTINANAYVQDIAIAFDGKTSSIGVVRLGNASGNLINTNEPTFPGAGGGAAGWKGTSSNTTSYVRAAKGADGGVFIYV